MAKKQQPKKIVKTEPVQTKTPDKRFWLMAAIIFVVSFIFYASSIGNEYALDDGITIEKNEFVHKGTSGIRDILTKDAMASFFKQVGSKGQLSGGRYRPLSIVTFAIEYEMFGFQPGDMISVTGTDGKTYKGKVKKIAPGGEVYFTTKEFGDGMQQFTKIHQFKSLAHAQHFFNVLLFALSMVVLYVFLSTVIFKNLTNGNYWALFATLLFAMHPLHTEVVANIKSRDEILSLLFILLTLIQFNKFLQKPNLVNGGLMGIFFFLAMLSKEYGAVLLIIIPIWTFIIHKKIDSFDAFVSYLSKRLIAVLPLIIAFVPYYLLRSEAVMIGDPKDVKPDVLNDYFMFAKGDEARATQTYILFKYFLLQIFPYPLASDYSFKTIAYRHFSSPEVIASIVFHLGLVGWLIWSIIKKNLIVGFALMFYLFNLLLVSNFVFNIGASMGERLVYHSSLGLIILFVYGIYWFTKKMKEPKTSLYIAGGITAIIAIPFFMITQGRNAAWKNDYTLATTDVKTHPNSALLNANACTYLVQKSDEFANKDKEIELTQEARKYDLKALEIHPQFANAWMNLAVIDHKLKNYRSEENAIRKVIEIFPNNPKVPLFKNMLALDYVNVGFEQYKGGRVDSCFYYLYKAKTIDPMNAEVLCNMGEAYLGVANQPDSAYFYFKSSLNINPKNERALNGFATIVKANPQLQSELQMYQQKASSY